MGAFGVPWLSKGLEATGFRQRVDPNVAALEKMGDKIIEIRKGSEEIANTIQRTDLHKQIDGITDFTIDKKASGFVRETKREVLEIDPRVQEKRKSISSDYSERGNLEKLIPTKKTKRQIEKGQDVITFKRQTAESKEYNQPIDRVKPFEDIRETRQDLKLEEQLKLEETAKSEKEKRKPVFEEVLVERDTVFRDGELLDVYVKLDGKGKVIGTADYITRTEGFDPVKTDLYEGLVMKATAESAPTSKTNTVAFAERFGFKIGGDGAVIAKLSDLVKLKEDKGTRIKSTKDWLNKAIVDTTKIKTTLETQLSKRVNDYSKVLDRTTDTANKVFSALLDKDAFKNVGLSQEKSGIEVDHLIYSYKMDGSKSRKKGKDGRPQEKDINEKNVSGVFKMLNDGLRFTETYINPPKMIGGIESSRLIKAYVSALEKMNYETQALINLVDYKKRVVTEKGDVFDQKYIFEEGAGVKGIRSVVSTALNDVVVQRGLDGAMTKFEALIQRGGKEGINSALKIMRARIDRDNIMYDSAIKNVTGKDRTSAKIEKEYLSKNSDGTFKYQMTYERMQKEFKLTKEEIDIIKLMDQGLYLKALIYNNAVGKFKSQDSKPIQIRPNYDPRSWFGLERAFIKAKEKTTLESGQIMNKGDTVAVIPGHTRPELNRFMKVFLQRNPEFADTSKFSVNKFRKNEYGERTGQPLIDAFLTTHEYHKLLPADVVSKIRKVESEVRAKNRFFVAPVQRKGVRGAAGEQPGMEGLQNYIRAHKDYGRGAIRAAKGMEFRHNWEIHLNSEIGQRWRKDFPNQMKVIEMYLDNALGRNDAAVTKVINKTVDVIGENFRNMVGNVPLLNKLPDAILTANKITLYSKLLFWNVRFMSAQVVQPWQVVIPKLEQLKVDYNIKGSTSEALARGSYEIFFRSDKEFVKALGVAVERGVIDQKFLKEFNDYIQSGGSVRTPGQRKIETMLDATSGKTASGALERFSRLQSFAFMYYFLKSGKRDKEVGKKQMIEEAGELSNNLMVEYDYKNRAFLYGNKGLGALGSFIGLFKTFQHNYYGKTAEYVRTWARNGFKKGAEPLLFHIYSQIFTAGLFGLMAIEQADALVDWMNGVLSSYGKEPMFTTPSDLILVSDLPTSAKFGLPSAAMGGDMSSTLAAPGMGLADIFSFPSMDYLFGLMNSNNSGIVGEGFNFIGKTVAGSMTDADVYKFLKVTAPPVLQGEIDRRWGVNVTQEGDLVPKPAISLFGKEGIFNPWREDPRATVHDDVSNVFYEKVKDKYVIRDPYKGMRGKIKRDAEGFLYKYLSGKSFEESLVLKAIYANNKISRNIKTKKEAMVVGASLELLNQRYTTAMFYVEALIAQGYTYDEAMKKIFNRMEMMNNTVIDRIKGLDKPSKMKQSSFLLDVLHNNRLDDSYIPGSAYD
jgi:hypothetical protein